MQVGGAGLPPIDASACANAYHSGTGCVRCVQACPVSALVLSGERSLPRIDPKRCLACGACIPVCPLDAFDGRRATRQTLIAVADMPAGPVLLVCDSHRVAATSLPGHRVTHGRCLVSLGVEDLVEVVDDGAHTLWLDDSACSECEIAVVWDRIRAATAAANELAHSFGRPALVHLASTTTGPAGSPPPAGGWIDARSGGLSRRATFRSIGRAIADQLHHAGGIGTTTPRRRRLLRLLENWGPPEEPALPTERDIAGFGRIQVDVARCSACGLCAQFCPTDALAFVAAGEHTADQNFALLFRASLCVGCLVCEAACPENALTVESLMDPQAIGPVAVTTVAAGTLAPCTTCGSRTSEGRARCFSCQSGVVTTALDEAGLMADLLAKARASDAGSGVQPHRRRSVSGD